MKKRSLHVPSLRESLALAAVAGVLFPVFLTSVPWPETARDYLEAHGVVASGAINLVSAIYLGYRAFDTLGETIVLLVAVSGTIGLLLRSGAILTEGYDGTASDPGPGEAARNGVAPVVWPEDPRKTHGLRTHLLEVVTGVLAPVVLLFGYYVMLYGHLSPGGGFQGGVVLASGIVFLALGNRMDATTTLIRPAVLNRLEAAAFLLLILAALSAIVLGGGVFDNPLAGVSRIPKAGYIVLLNAIIGLKVGAGIGFMCIAMLGHKHDD